VTTGHQVRNPHGGRVEWRGDFSAASALWTRELRTRLCYPEDAPDDGTFWMAFPDFVSVFNRIYVCMLVDTSEASVCALAGSWAGDTAGGCSDFAKWRHNPKWELRVRSPARVFITVGQPDQRRSQALHEYTPIGVSVVRMREWGPSLVSSNYDVVARTAYWPKREVACEARAAIFLERRIRSRCA
jgi:hypothetical protein